MDALQRLREQYAPLAEQGELYRGIVIGIDLARGAAMEDLVEKLRELPAPSGEPPWRASPRSSNGARGSRNQDASVQVYALIDPRPDHEPEREAFYIGSAMDPEKQLRDYMRSDGVNVSAKPRIDEIVADGYVPEVEVLATTTVRDASTVKQGYIESYRARGHSPLNQRV